MRNPKTWIAPCNSAKPPANQSPGCQQVGCCLPKRNDSSWAGWPGAESASTIRVYSVVQRPDKTVEAIIDVTVTKRAYPETKNPYMIVTDPHRMILAPSTLNQREYVVVEDVILDRHEAQEYPESFQPLYAGKGKEARC